MTGLWWSTGAVRVQSFRGAEKKRKAKRQIRSRAGGTQKRRSRISARNELQSRKEGQNACMTGLWCSTGAVRTQSFRGAEKKRKAKRRESFTERRPACRERLPMHREVVRLSPADTRPVSCPCNRSFFSLLVLSVRAPPAQDCPGIASCEQTPRNNRRILSEPDASQNGALLRPDHPTCPTDGWFL